LGGRKRPRRGARQQRSGRAATQSAGTGRCPGTAAAIPRTGSETGSCRAAAFRRLVHSATDDPQSRSALRPTHPGIAHRAGAPGMTQTAAGHSPAIALTWETHRRTRELCDWCELPLHDLTLDAGPLKRYATLRWRTLRLLAKQRPRVVYVQNPSLILA